MVKLATLITVKNDEYAGGRARPLEGEAMEILNVTAVFEEEGKL